MTAATKGSPNSGSRTTSIRSPAASESAAGEVSGLAQANRGVGAEREAALQPFGGPRGGHDAGRAEQLGGLHRDLAEHAAGAEHQNVLALLQPGAPGEREPGGQAGDPQRDGDALVEAVGQRVRGGGVNQRALGHRAEGNDRRVEVHALAVEQPDPLAPRDRWQRRLTGVEAPRADRDIDRVQTGGKNLDDRLAGPGGGLLELAGARHSVFVQDGGSHPVTPYAYVPTRQISRRQEATTLPGVPPMCATAARTYPGRARCAYPRRGL